MKKLIVWTDFDEIMEDLSYAERGRLFTAMLEYAKDDSAQPDMISGNEKFLWKAQKKAIDAQWESYRKQCDRADAARGNNPKNRTEDSSELSEVSSPTSEVRCEISEVRCITNTNTNTNKRKEKENKSESERFRAPSLEEVAEYCRERNNGIDPQHFLDFYESRGWMYGKTRIKDWKKCVNTWEKREEEEKKKKQTSSNQFLNILMKEGDAL